MKFYDAIITYTFDGKPHTTNMGVRAESEHGAVNRLNERMRTEYRPGTLVKSITVKARTV